MNDGLLLRRYLEERDEPAFLELVTRHMNLVYSTALRRMGNPDLAQDISQAVFLLLAGKAARLIASEDLAGWLHRATCLKAGEHLRAERRRRFHENEAAIMNEAIPPHPDRWAELARELDEAVDHLDRSERDLILWRFYSRASWQEIGRRLGVNEDAARMRLKRALEKLRGKLAHASALTTATFGEWLEANAAPAAPVSLLREIAQALPRVPPGCFPPGLGLPASALGVLTRWQQVLIGTAACALVGLGLFHWQTRGGPEQSNRPPEPRSMRAPTRGGAGGFQARKVEVLPSEASDRGELEGLLEKLRSILHSELNDGVLPPQDLRDAISALGEEPRAVFALLLETLGDPSVRQLAHERAIWGLWLVGESNRELVPELTPVLAEIIASPEKPNLWWHAADVLVHLSIPEESLSQVRAALGQNPAAAYSSLRFLAEAARRHPAVMAETGRDWLAGPDSLRFCAAVVLARVPGENPEPLLPILIKGLNVNPQRDHALDTLEGLGRAASSAAPDLRRLLAAAATDPPTWFTKRLVEVLASVAPETRAEIPGVDAILREREEEAALNRLLEDDPFSIPNLVACLKNPKTSWKAALDLETLGPDAAEALPALREALAEPNGQHKGYLAKAIKAIDPASPKPLFERDDLLGTLRALSATVDELGAQLEESERQWIVDWSTEIRSLTPDQLAGQAVLLGKVHPRLRDEFVANLVRADAALRTVLVEETASQ